MELSVNTLAMAESAALVLTGQSNIKVNYFIGRTLDALSQALKPLQKAFETNDAMKAYADFQKENPRPTTKAEKPEEDTDFQTAMAVWAEKRMPLEEAVHAEERKVGDMLVEFQGYKIKLSQFPDTIQNGATVQGHVLSAPAQSHAQRVMKIFGPDVTFDQLFGWLVRVLDVAIDDSEV